MMKKNLIRNCFVLLSMVTTAPIVLADDRARVTLGIPTYTTHSDARSNPKGWNEGWLQNEGMLVDATWPVAALGTQTTLRAGVTGGIFDNSEFRTSVFAGGVGEIETHVTNALAFSLGTYAGAITGYKNSVSPALAPYLGTSYALTDRLEIGARGFWLPAKTFGGSSVAESDAYVGVVTIGTRF